MAKAPPRRAKTATRRQGTKARPSKRPKALRTRSLKEYQAKRNFGVSPEPAGDKTSGTKKPRAARGKGKGTGHTFVVQKHLASHLHYDFRLEHGGTLVSWAVPKGPSLNPRDKRLAMRVEDHPLDYANFEGVIPEGYGAGIVMVWDTGTWTPEPGFEDVDAALKDGELKFRLAGVKLKGSWVLVRTGGGRPDASGESRTWLLIKHRDDWAGEVDVLTAAPKSVKSFGDFEDILAGKEPAVWESHRPAKGGAAGKMLAEVIARAAKKKAGKKGRG
ncbi:MAG: DNA polymerase ligase N-terminal domain-containing protein [Phycisphaerae bacterium]|nr:DNA polymerase ligase N-terminal domain-containing protein [Tepidisphaeraceae bacterium]